MKTAIALVVLCAFSAAHAAWEGDLTEFMGWLTALSSQWTIYFVKQRLGETGWL